MSSPRPSRREREQKFRSDLVLDAAEAVFAAHGFQGASMEEIARRAELSVGSLYNVFPSKDALLAGVVERRQEEVLAGATAQAATESPPLRRLDLLLLFAFDYFEAHEKLFELYVAATSGLLWHVRSSLGESTFQRHLRFLGLISQAVRDGMRREGWPRVDPDSAAWVIVAMLNAFLTRWITSGDAQMLVTGRREARGFVRRILGLAPGAPEPTRSSRKRG